MAAADDSDDCGIMMKLKTNGETMPGFELPPQTPEAPQHYSKSSLRRNISYGNMLANSAEAKVMVIYTGGTIGMIRNSKNGKIFFYMYGEFAYLVLFYVLFKIVIIFYILCLHDF